MKQKNQLEKLLIIRDKYEKLTAEIKNDIKADVTVVPVSLKSKHSVQDKSHTQASSRLVKKPRPDIETPYMPPQTEIEKILAENWEEVLGFDQIGINDNFFDLGGHSLIAAALATRLSNVFATQFPLSQLMEIPTIAQLAKLIEANRWAAQNLNNSGKSDNNSGKMEEGSL